MGLLWYTPEKIGNAVIRVVYKPVENSSNSGVSLFADQGHGASPEVGRMEHHGDHPGRPAHDGDGERRQGHRLHTEGQPVPPKKKSYEPDRGRRPDEGYIGLQNHSDKDVVYFKEVAVKPLSR